MKESSTQLLRNWMIVSPAMTDMAKRVLVLRLAGPLQCWGLTSQYNRRETASSPTKSGVIGLLAAAEGRRRADSIEDLLDLRLGVRVDQPGSLLRDYHTVSDLTGKPLLSSALTARSTQKPTSPKKFTHVTHRYYLQDACFVAAVEGEADLVSGLAEAMARPAFPLALGRRSCVPALPMVLRHGDESVWDLGLEETLAAVPWQASVAHAKRLRDRGMRAVSLPVTLDDPQGTDVLADVPRSFAPQLRGMSSRRVRSGWVSLPNPGGDDPGAHDPFELTGA